MSRIRITKQRRTAGERRGQEALAAEGDRARPRRQHAFTHLGRWRDDLRATAQGLRISLARLSAQRVPAKGINVSAAVMLVFPDAEPRTCTAS